MKNYKENNSDDYVPSYMEEVITKHWLMGDTRDEIAKEFHISTGKASNIWDKFRDKLGHYEANALREFGRQLRQQNMTAENCAVGFRISKIIELGIPDEKINEFLITINEILKETGIYPETLRDALIQFAQISDKVPFSELPYYLQKINQEIKEKENKKKQLEEDIQNLEREKAATEEQTRTVLSEANTTLFHLNNFRETKVKLAKFDIIVEDIDKFTRCLEGVARHSNYDPFKVIEKL
jgi:vacuolar-type H+-ATPase subunit I/STV1